MPIQYVSPEDRTGRVTTSTAPHEFLDEAVANLAIPSMEELVAAEVATSAEEVKADLTTVMQWLRVSHPENNSETGKNWYRSLGIKQAIKNNLESANSPHRNRTHVRNDLGRGKILAFTKTWLTKNINKTVVEFDDFNKVGNLLNLDYEPTLKAIPEYVSATANFYNNWEKIPEAWYKKLQSESFTAHMNLERTKALHMLHVSTDDPHKVAYFPTWRTILQDRPQRTTMGKYLTKYKDYLGLSELEIKTLAEHFAAIQAGASGWKLHFAGSNDPDSWYEVYKKGPHSCMVGNTAVKVYAHDKSELRLAYVENGAGDIIARCIIRDTSHTKGYLRVYPDPSGTKEGTWLLDQLTIAGYGEEINLNGCLLAAEEVYNGYGYTCPYIDTGDGGEQYCDTTYRDGRDYLILGQGPYACDTTNGYVDVNIKTCDICDDRMAEDDQNYIEGEDTCVCDSCVQARFYWAISENGHHRYVRDRNVSRCESDGEMYDDDYLSENDVYKCEHSGDYYKLNDMVSVMGGYVADKYAEQLDHLDIEGNCYADEDDAFTLSDGTLCHKDEVSTLSDGRTCHITEYDDLEDEIAEALEALELEADAESEAEAEAEAEVLSAVIVTEPQTQTNTEFAVAA